MNKKLLSIGIIIIILLVGFSGCTDVKFEDKSVPSIEIFTVEPSIINDGETANLTWTVTNATIISIDNSIGNVSKTGSRIINPSKTMNYTLTTINGNKTIKASTRIIVISNNERFIGTWKDDDFNGQEWIFTFSEDGTYDTNRTVPGTWRIINTTHLELALNDDAVTYTFSFSDSYQKLILISTGFGDINWKYDLQKFL